MPRRGECSQGWNCRAGFLSSFLPSPVQFSAISLESRAEFGLIKPVAEKVISEIKMVLSFDKNVIIYIT